MSNPRGVDDAVRRARIAVSVLFFTNALTLSAWLPRLAELQADISLNDVAVGAALAAGAAGGIAAGVSAGPLIHRWGSQRVAMAALFIVAPILPLIGLAPGAWTLGFVLLLVGGLDASVSPEQQGLEIIENLRSQRIVPEILQQAGDKPLAGLFKAATQSAQPINFLEGDLIDATPLGRKHLG